MNVPNSFLLQYDIQDIKVNISTENISNIQTVLNRQRNSHYYYQSKNRNNDIDFEIDCQCHSKFENCQQDEGNNIRTKQNEVYHQESSLNKLSKTIKSKTNKNQLNMEGIEANRVDKFTKLIMDGPVNVCIICNRCLYARSVLRFHQGKYDMDMDKVPCNCIQQEHICRTCDLHLKKKKIPPHAICNKSNIPSVPCELKNLNRLERVLVSRRLLFKKVTIMPKGCFPKLKGAICNIVVETNDIVNVLPRGANSSDLFVKLKRKLSFRSHVYL